MDGRKYLFPVCSGAEGDWPVCKGVRSDGILDSRLRLARERLHACERQGEDAPVRVDGQDIDPPGDASYALTCRAYRLEDDRISPLPSKDMIRRALRSMAGSSPG